MSVSAIQNNNQYKKRRMNYLPSMVVGALGGYAAKWILPPTEQERDAKYIDEFIKLKDNSDIDSLNFRIKRIRPTNAFIALGISAAFTIALINNIFVHSVFNPKYKE